MLSTKHYKKHFPVCRRFSSESSGAMNPGGYMSPLVNTQFSSPYSSDGSERSAMLPPISPHSRAPVTRYPAGSPFFSPGPPRSMPHSPVFSSLPPLSTSWSPLPPKSPSPSSLRHGPVNVGNPSPSSSFSCHPLNPSPSAPVENRDSSIAFEQNPSFPPPVPFAGNTPRKAHHKRSNSMSPWNNPESVYPELSQQFLGDSSCRNQGNGASKSDGKATDRLYYEFLNVSDVNNDNGGDDTDVMIDLSQYEDHTSTLANETRSTTSGVKRRAGKDIEDSSGRHYRSVSTDTCLMPPPSSRNLLRKVSSTSSVDGNKNASSVKIPELDKIANNARLKEIESDEKRIKRILGNRLSAQRSKERKARQLVMLQHTVERLQIDNDSLSTKAAQMEIENEVLKNMKKKLKIQVESLEQQAKLRDALNDQLRGEVRRLRLTNEVIPDQGQFDRSNMESLNPNMFQQQPNTNQLIDFVGQNQGN